MKASHRILVTGAAGGLAAAVVAASASFACTPQATLGVTSAGSDYLAPTSLPGATLEVHIDKFHPSGGPYGNVKIYWQYPNGQEPYLTEIAGPETAEGVTVRIPEDAPSSARLPQFVVAEQRTAGGVLEQRREVALTVWNGTEMAPPPTGPPASVPTGPPASVPTGPPASVPTGPPASVPTGPPASVPTGPPASVPTGPPTSERAGTPGSTPGTGRGSGGGAPAGSTGGAIRSIGPDGAALPATGEAPTPAVSSDEQAAAPVADGPVDRIGPPRLAPSDLWSGLEPGRSTSLLDPVESPANGSNPLGGVLLVSGIVAMAAVAAVAGRRRLVLARTIGR